MTALTITPLITNDPKQRPTISVWSTALNYLVPMILMIILNVVMLPAFGGTYNLTFLTTVCKLCLAVGAADILLVCIGVSEYDKPENFGGLSSKKETLKVKDMVEVIKNNRPLQCYIVSNASDKIAQQTASQAIITTMLNGIIIGDIGIFTVLYVILTLAKNGANMCVTTAGSAFMSDIIDYELDRSGRYIPAVVTGTYSFVDKIITAFSAVIATGSVALTGYTSTMQQPGDAATPQIFWLTMFITFGLPILRWFCTLAAMKFCHLTKEDMIEVQKRIAEKKLLHKTSQKLRVFYRLFFTHSLQIFIQTALFFYLFPK